MSTGQEKNEIDLRKETLSEAGLEALAKVTAAIPVIGGAISSAASGAATGRKMGRLFDAVSALDHEIDDILAQFDDVYVHSEDFEEMAGEIFGRIRDAHSIDRRRMLLNFFENDCVIGGTIEYDQKIKLLRLVDEVEPQLLIVLDAMMRPTLESESASMMGSVAGTIQKKLPLEFSGDLSGALKELVRLGLIQDNVMWGATVTAPTANDTNRATSDGAALITFIREPIK